MSEPLDYNDIEDPESDELIEDNPDTGLTDKK